MIKSFLSLAAVSFLSLTVHAQTPDVKIGAKVGYNNSKITNSSEASSRSSFHIGGLVEIFINDKFSIQPEVLYSSQGAKLKVEDLIVFENNLFDVNVKGTLKMDYILVPIMAKYYFAEGFNIQVGPQFGYLASSKFKIDRVLLDGKNIDFSASEKELSTIDNLKDFDFGVNFGAGYELPIGVFFDARYNVGLTKINKEGFSSKNGVFQLSVGYKF